MSSHLPRVVYGVVGILVIVVVILTGVDGLIEFLSSFPLILDRVYNLSLTANLLLRKNINR
jgi:hypothetical protein